MEIDIDMMKYLEELSRLSLSGEERVKTSKELESIIRYMDVLNEVNTDGIPALPHPFNTVNVFREDEVAVTASYSRSVLLENAPEKTAEYFIAPKTVE